MVGLALSALASGCEVEEVEAVINPDATLFEPGAHERPRRLKAVSLSVGTRHACAVTDTGRLVCWGDGAEVGRTDGAAGRLAAVSVGELATGALYESGDVQTNPAWPLEHSERPWPLEGVTQSTLVGERRVRQFELGHGLDQRGCVLWRDGKLFCKYDRRLTATYDESVEDYGTTFVPFGTFRGLREHSWQWISPHAGLVGCGLEDRDRFRCWTSEVDQDLQFDETIWVSDPFGRFDGVLHLLPEDTLHACASPAMVCRADRDGRVQCWSTEVRQIPQRPRLHTLTETPTIEFDGGEVVQLACGAVTGPVFYDPPFFGPPTHGRVCVVDSAGRLTCVGEDGEHEQLFPQHRLTAVDTSGPVTCALTEGGSVRCFAHTAEPPYLSLEEVPRGLAL